MSNVYRFGKFELLPQQRRLLDSGRPVSLGHRAFDVLVALVERAGNVVAKDELLGVAWPGLVVEENNLQVQVSALRKVLGPSAIATSAGHGYRFTLDLAAAGARPATAHAPRHNLPPTLTSFVGHEDDLEEYAALVGEARLVTATGIGGCGKTRLAIELAQRVAPDFDDGVHYVDLAPLQDPDRLALTVATSLGQAEEGDTPIVDTVLALLAKRRLLLVLDNCEHLSSACAALVRRALVAAPGVNVLATSREGLGVPGERALTVRSLSFPPADAESTEEWDACESVRLFVERARLSAPRFAVTSRNVGVVGEICRRLDGIPLAIELAAARVKVFSVEEIRARLDDRFRLLTGGSQTALGRQQTLLAVIQWSYDHLSAAEQRLLRRLSVFVGGWTVDGAVRVAGEDLDEYAVVDLLSRLIDQSLVTIRESAQGATRFSMLETVREYASWQLRQAGEVEAARDRHLDHVVAFAQLAEPNLLSPDQSGWLLRIDAERENVLAAHAWCEQRQGLGEAGLVLVSSLGRYWLFRGLLPSGHRLAARALEHASSQGRSVVRGRALFKAAMLGYFMGRYDEAKASVAESLAITEELHDDATAADALRLLGTMSSTLKDDAIAREYVRRSIELSRALGDNRRLGAALNSLAEIHRVAGESIEAERLYRTFLGLSRETGNRSDEMVALANLALLAIPRGEAEAARASIAEGLALAEDVGPGRHASITFLDCAAALAGLVGDWPRAARLGGAVETLRAHTGYHREAADEPVFTMFVARTVEALGETAYGDCETAGRALSYEETFAEVRTWIDAMHP